MKNTLGPAQFTEEDAQVFDEVGVATGLAWTSFGGSVLYIESTMMAGTGLTLTGQLGDVMQESAKTAMGYIRSKAEDFGIENSVFKENELHVHFTSRSNSKRWPSAGITLATSLVSLLTNMPIDKSVAMTGEITLTGKVLPIGGLKEKALAAMRMDIKKIIIPWKNKKDLVDIPEEYRKKLRIYPSKEFYEVLEVAIVNWSEYVKSVSKKQERESKNKRPSIAA